MITLMPDPAAISPAHREHGLPPVPFGPAPLVWEALRLRRFKASARKALVQVLRAA